MDLDLTPDEVAFRDEARTWLREHLPTDARPPDGQPMREFDLAWQQTLHAGGWAGINWPVEYGGRGLTDVQQMIWYEEFARANPPFTLNNSCTFVGNNHGGPTLMACATEEQKSFHLPKILKGEVVWCQGFSEPNAGSDLAGIATKAVLDGDEWVINGQKIWTTYGHLANHMFVLCRTDADAPRHKGITFLLMPMGQPGVEVRPIKMMSGESEFNEVFLTDARCPRDAVVGEVNGGWAVAMTLLGFERGEAAALLPIRFREELDRLVELARSRGRAEDPLVRQGIAHCYAKVEIMRYLGLRTLTSFLAGHAPGPDAAITKLYWSEYHKVVTDLALRILGVEATAPTGRWPSNSISTDDAGAPPDSASWVGTAYVAMGGTIYAGSSQVQRNIIGERILGLPKEPTGT